MQPWVPDAAVAKAGAGESVDLGGRRKIDRRFARCLTRLMTFADRHLRSILMLFALGIAFAAIWGERS